MFRPGSLHQRLARGIALALLGLFILQYLGVDLALQHLTRSYVRSRLEHDQENLLQALEMQPGGIPLLRQDRLSPTFLRPFSGHYYLIQTQSLSLGSRSLWNHVLPTLPLARGQIQMTYLASAKGPLRQPLLLLSRGFEKGGQTLTLTVAEDLSTLESQMTRFRWSYALISGLFLFVLLALQAWLLRLGLRPLLAMQADLLALEQGQKRDLGLNLPAELLPLALAFNRLLVLFQVRLQRSRESLGDLSHALKRPLTRIYQLLESRPWPEVEAEAQQLKQLIELELQRARTAGTAQPGLSVHLSEAVSDIQAVLTPIYATRALHFELDLPRDLRVWIDREDLLEVLGNLLDNACKWAASTVTIRAGQTDSHWWLEICDDGPGCPEALLADLTQRGVRADEHMPGHGLGLAIARRIVSSYGGQLTLANLSPGLGVKIEMPQQF